MNFRLIVLIAFSIALCASCEPSSQNQAQDLRKEIIEVHDEVMPLMGKLKSLEKKASTQAEDILQNDPSDTLAVQNLKALAYDLSEAHEGMFVWMRQYESEDGERSEEELMQYLEVQMEKVKQVHDAIQSSLANADELLDEN